MKNTVVLRLLAFAVFLYSPLNFAQEESCEALLIQPPSKIGLPPVNVSILGREMSYRKELVENAEAYLAALYEKSHEKAFSLKMDLDEKIEKGLRAERLEFFPDRNQFVHLLSEKAYKREVAWKFIEPALRAAALAYGDKAERFFWAALRRMRYDEELKIIFEIISQNQIWSLAPSLREHFRLNKNSEIRLAAIENLIQMYTVGVNEKNLNDYRNELVRKTIVAALSDTNIKIKRLAFKSLAENPEIFLNEDRKSFVKKGTENGDRMIRFTTFKFVASNFDKLSISEQRRFLLMMVEDPFYGIRQLSIPLLSHNFDNSSASLLKKLLADSNSDVRKNAYAFLIEEHLEQPITIEAWKPFFLKATDEDLDVIVSIIVQRGLANPALARMALLDLKERIKQNRIKNRGFDGATREFPLTEVALIERRREDSDVFKRRRRNEPGFVTNEIEFIVAGIQRNEPRAWKEALTFRNNPQIIKSVFTYGTHKQILTFVQHMISESSVSDLHLFVDQLEARIEREPGFKNDARDIWYLIDQTSRTDCCLSSVEGLFLQYRLKSL